MLNRVKVETNLAFSNSNLAVFPNRSSETNNNSTTQSNVQGLVNCFESELAPFCERGVFDDIVKKEGMEGGNGDKYDDGESWEFNIELNMPSSSSIGESAENVASQS